MQVRPDQDYFTARELAAVASANGLPGYSERSIRDLATREGWDRQGGDLVRSRLSPEGGRPGVEYHRSLIPDALKAVLYRQPARVVVMTEQDAEIEATARRVAALKQQALGTTARGVLGARAEVLTAIEGYGLSHGERRSWAVRAFLAAQKAWMDRQDFERRRDSGEILTDREVASLGYPLALLAADGFHLDPARLAAANARGKGKDAAISERSLWRWFKARDGQGVLSLAPVPPRVNAPIPPAFRAFLRFYAKPQKPTVVDAYGEYLKDAAKRNDVQPMTLTKSQVEYIVRHRLNPIEKMVGREGLLTLRSRLAYVTRTTEDMLPTTIYSADGKTFDAEIADPLTKRPIRPEITTVIDVVTRKIVGTSLARSENQRSVAEALRNACVGCGIPAIFYVDRGPGYRNEAMDADVGGLMGRLHITKMHAAPYGSQAKGRIEIVNKTVWDTLAKRLPTFIGEGMDKEAGQKVHKITRREIKEFGQSRHLPSWEDFVGLVERMVIEYNAKPHSSLPKFSDPATGRMRNMSPDEAWATHVAAGFEAVDVDPAEADDLFRPYEIRTARRAQVKWNNNDYFDHALEALHGQKVMVGYDYHQADRVWVRDFDRETGQPGRLICVARFMGNAERYVPVSYEQKAIATRAKGQLVRIGRKVEAIEDERDQRLMVELQAVTPVPFVDLSEQPTPVPVEIAVDAVTDLRPTPPRRRTFATDEELAEWALQNPGDLTANQIRVLTGCLKDATARKLLELSGIDTEALATLLRAAA
ncbi:Mu transposase C-terminal domain-containing protein [Pseudorhodobacter sp.]|uniref:Mu transposase C-terminal domain-containing protein n=1 Tax=Pseudorhodobacter sp. TaxID=1934400 RepID=UPI002649C7BD|nr:Mu transposase C-terminal domain-containing protein [Pseudorhodobacter sp.]MDN5785717.1 Mu transposase C-terminal domain-containing protein [Pseudorhodobacter sp.]